MRFMGISLTFVTGLRMAIWQAVMKWVANRLMARIDKAAEGIESPLLQHLPN